MTKSAMLLKYFATSGLIFLLVGAQFSNPQESAGLVDRWPSSSKRFALVIGVGDYDDSQISRLEGALNDSKALARALIRYAAFPPDQVILLSSDQPVERRPTRGNILRRLSNLRAAIPRDGLLLVSFAGHGIERGGRAYLLPSDAQLTGDDALLEDTAINVESVRERVAQTGVRQVVLIIDACRNAPEGGRPEAGNPMSPVLARGFDFEARNRDVTAFAALYATEVGQRAYEYRERRQGYFTWALVEGLKGGAGNEKGEVTLGRLIKFLQDVVPRRVSLDLGKDKRQRPFVVMSGYKADELLISVAGSSVGNETSNFSFTENVSDPKSSTDAQAELAYWNYLKDSEDSELLEGFLQKFPEGTFAALASARLKKMKRSFPDPLAGSGEARTDKIVTALNGRIIFASNLNNKDTEIYLVNPDNTGRINISNSAGEDIAPAWSPDGAKIAFASQRDVPGQSVYEIYTMNVDGSNQTRLTNNAAQEFDPSWSPDGTKIAFDTDRDGNREIYVMNVDGTEQTRLTNNPAQDFEPCWSPDGTKIAFASERDGKLRDLRDGS